MDRTRPEAAVFSESNAEAYIGDLHGMVGREKLLVTTVVVITGNLLVITTSVLRGGSLIYYWKSLQVFLLCKSHSSCEHPDT